LLKRAEILDPDLVTRLARLSVHGPPSIHPLRGIHASSRRGASLEFSEHTEYASGEDIRDLDWKVYAKSDRYFIKRYEDERLQQAVVVVDASGSMRYGAASPESPAGSKYHAAARVAAALTSRLIGQGDAVGLEICGGDRPVGRLSSRSGNRQFESIVETLASAEPSGTANLFGTLRFLGERLKRDSSVFILSDFLDDALPLPEALSLLAARSIRPRLVQILHRDEVDLPFERTTRFLDLESDARETLDPEAVRDAYVEELGAYITAFSEKAERYGIPYTLFLEDEDPAPGLISLLGSTRRA